MTEDLSSQEKEPRRLPHNIYFALVLYSQFPVIDQLKASCEVVDFVINLPHSKGIVIMKLNLLVCVKCSLVNTMLA